MNGILNLCRLLLIGTVSAHSCEESDLSVSLLQFQVDTFQPERLSLSSIVTATGHNTSASSANSSQSKSRRRSASVWISGILLFIAFLSLLRHLVPLLLNAWARREPDPGPENDAYEDNGVTCTAPSASASMIRECTQVALYGLLYITLSCTLIKYNDFLMSDGRFPYAVNLTFGHQAFGSFVLYALYKLRPSLYPSLNRRSAEVPLSGRVFLQGLVPVAACFSGQLVLSNVAYIFSSVAFIQMMKEGNMVLVYLGSLLVGLESFHSVRARVLLCLLLSTALTIQGQIAFSPTGFLVQGAGQLLEAARIVLQSVLLSAAGSGQLDPYSYNLLVQPTCALLIGGFMFIAYALPTVPLADWTDYVVWFPHLIANCFVALTLNLSIALFMARSTAVGFIIAGVMKDIFLILADVVISGTEVSRLQYIAFGLQICFVATYSLIKLYSKQLEPDDPKAEKK